MSRVSWSRGLQAAEKKTDHFLQSSGILNDSGNVLLHNVGEHVEHVFLYALLVLLLIHGKELPERLST